MATAWLDRSGTRWALGFSAWTVFVALSAIHGLMFLERVQSSLPRGQMMLDRALDWYTCALFTPFFFWMVRRWPLAEGRIGRAVAVYTAGIAVATILKYAVFVPLGQWLTPAFARSSLRETLARNFIPEAMAFAAMLGVVLAVEYARAIRERDAREARLSADLANARLSALAAQLQPHFLFNTLHGIGTLLRRDPDAAESMLVRLADLLRRTLQPDAPEIPFHRELELLQAYLDIQQLRFGDRLSVHLDIAPAVRDALVPRLLLQPLVENAFQHGVAAKAGPARIVVRARSDDGHTLELSVTDDGPGLRGGAGEGTGLGNTRSRLQVHYGGGASLVLASPNGSGMTATVRLPLRLEPGARS